MVVRPAQPEDMDQLARHLDQVDGLSHAACLDNQSSDQGVYLIALHGDTPVGRLFVRWRNTEVPRIAAEHPQAAPLADMPEICDVYVVPEHRSEGIGTRLVERALECARDQGVSQVTICVNTDNPRARALYERLGFAESGIGVFTTSGTILDASGEELPWQNGPQVLLVQSLG